MSGQAKSIQGLLSIDLFILGGLDLHKKDPMEESNCWKKALGIQIECLRKNTKTGRNLILSRLILSMRDRGRLFHARNFDGNTQLSDRGGPCKWKGGIYLQFGLWDNSYSLRFVPVDPKPG